MYEKLKDENVIVDITNLINRVEKVEDDIDSYCEFMKGLILNTSGIN